MGVSRINHVLRVHGHTILQEQRAAEIYDEVGQRSLERLFPGLTEDRKTQATLSAGRSGIGYQRARDIAAPAHVELCTHLPQVDFPPDACAGSVVTPARLHYQRSEETRQHSLGEWWAVSMLRFLPQPTTGTRRNQQHCRSHTRTLRVLSRCGLRHETCRPGHYYWVFLN